MFFIIMVINIGAKFPPPPLLQGIPSSTGPAGTEAEDLGSLAVGQGALEVDDRARSSKVTAV